MCFPPVDTQTKRLKSLLLSLFSFLLPFSFPSPLARQPLPVLARSARYPCTLLPGARCPATRCVTGGWSSRTVGENIPLGVKGDKLQHSWMSAGQTLVWHSEASGKHFTYLDL